MNKQPTFQSHQSVKVTDKDHPRFGQAGHVVDVQEVDHQVGTDGDGAPVMAVCVGVRFDDDRAEEHVPLSALQALN
jgi:hypothetical protein